MTNPAIPYLGGKWQLIPELHKYIPQKMDSYVEPFFGGGAMFFSSPRWAKLEIINDANQNVIAFLREVRDNQKRLTRYLEQTAFSRLEYNDAHHIIRSSKKIAQFKRAAAFFFGSDSLFIEYRGH